MNVSSILNNLQSQVFILPLSHPHSGKSLLAQLLLMGRVFYFKSLGLAKLLDLLLKLAVMPNLRESTKRAKALNYS